MKQLPDTILLKTGECQDKTLADNNLLKYNKNRKNSVRENRKTYYLPNPPRGGGD